MEPTDRSAFSRRKFLAVAGGALGAAALPRPPRLPGAWAAPAVQAAGPVFTLGVASGEPRPDGVVLWTRLAPDPLAGGGMPPVAVPVRLRWRPTTNSAGWCTPAWSWPSRTMPTACTSTSPASSRAAGTGIASPPATRSAPSAAPAPLPGAGRLAGRLRVRLRLLPALRARATTRRTGTWPRRTSTSSCTSVTTSTRAPAPTRCRAATPPARRAETTTLAGYRQRHAQYGPTPTCRPAHAAFPWLVTWDDHEVENNYAGDISENDAPRAAFLARRAAAYQAYYEHMPLPPGWGRAGSDMRLYRRLTFGHLAEFNVLDTRSTAPTSLRRPAGGRLPRRRGADPDHRSAPSRKRGCSTASGGRAARWNVIAQQVFMAQLDFLTGPLRGYNVDTWDGYLASRDRLMAFLAQQPEPNPVVLTGDFHSNWVADLKANFDDPNSATVGTEFVGTSISSGGDGSDTTLIGRTALAENGHLLLPQQPARLLRCTLTRDRWTADFRVVPYVLREGAPISTRASFVVEAGRPGASVSPARTVGDRA